MGEDKTYIVASLILSGEPEKEVSLAYNTYKYLPRMLKPASLFGIIILSYFTDNIWSALLIEAMIFYLALIHMLLS